MINKNPLCQFQRQRYRRKGKPLLVDPVRFQIIFSLAGTGKKILDLGCYYESFDKELAKRGNQVTALDISPEVVKRNIKAGIKAFECNLENDRWPVKKDVFDLVIAGEIIEHFLDTGKLLDNIHQVLKPKGKLILTTPNLASLGRRLLLLIGRNPEIEASFHPKRGGHVRYFVKDSLFILLKQHRFKVEEFTSDVILFNETQTLYSTRLAKLIPTLGKSLIVKARKK